MDVVVDQVRDADVDGEIVVAVGCRRVSRSTVRASILNYEHERENIYELMSVI